MGNRKSEQETWGKGRNKIEEKGGTKGQKNISIIMLEGEGRWEEEKKRKREQER